MSQETDNPQSAPTGAAVYLDNAATSHPKPRVVLDAVKASLDHSLTVARSTHHAQFRADDVLRRCRRRLAEFINAGLPEEIIYTFSATDSLNLAINGLVPPGSHALVSPLEHHSVMRPLHHLRRSGIADFSVLPADAAGHVDCDAIRRMMRPETSCIIINWVSNVSGTEQPLAKISRIASELEIDLLVDASQAAGTHPIDVQAVPCTAMAMPGHKSMMSIPGTGLLYLHRDREIPPWRIGGTGYRSELLFQPEDRPSRYESGTPNVPGIVGLDAALGWFAETGLDAISSRCRSLCDQLWAGLDTISGLKLIGPGMQEQRGFVVSFQPGDVDPITFSEVLASRFGISSRPGLHCAPSAHRHFGTYDTGGTVRLSVSYFTNAAEIEYTIRSIAETTAGF